MFFNFNNVNVLWLFFLMFLAPPCTTATFYKQDGSSACGFFLAKGLTWSQANAACSAAGARLPIINCDQENRDIWNLVVCLTFFSYFLVFSNLIFFKLWYFLPCGIFIQTFCLHFNSNSQPGVLALVGLWFGGTLREKKTTRMLFHISRTASKVKNLKYISLIIKN